MKNAESEVRKGNDNRFRDRIPNRYVVINPGTNPTYNQLVNLADLDVLLGSHVCFYVNKLDHRQFDDLLATIPDPATRQWVMRNQKTKRNINWLSATSYVPMGKNPCEPVAESIDLYNGFNLDQEGKRISLYGISELSIDFSKLPLVLSKEDNSPLYPFGIIFFSDLTNGFDDYSATVSSLPERVNEISHYKYIHPVSDDIKGIVTCKGKFRYRGNFIVFYVTNEIEREENVFYPDVTIVNISVGSYREQRGNYSFIKETGITNIRKGSDCVESIVEYITKKIFSYYEVKDQQFTAEIVHGFGFDPVSFGLPPSIGDERSHYYYGGNHVHMNSKGYHSRHEKPHSSKPNIFDYLKEIGSKETNIVLPPVTKNPDENKDPSDHSKNQGVGRGRKNRNAKYERLQPSVSDERDPVNEIEVQEEEYPAGGIDTALSVASEEPEFEFEEATKEERSQEEIAAALVAASEEPNSEDVEEEVAKEDEYTDSEEVTEEERSQEEIDAALAATYGDSEEIVEEEIVEEDEVIESGEDDTQEEATPEGIQ
jgi:hypothetical protein